MANDGEKQLESMIEVITRAIPREQDNARLYHETTRFSERQTARTFFEDLAKDDEQHELKLRSAMETLRRELVATRAGKPALESGDVLAQPQMTPSIYPAGGVEALVRWHPHPALVHFPIALCIAAAVFTIVSFFVQDPLRLWLDKGTLFSVILTAVFALPVVGTGLLTWIYSYSAAWTHIYRSKIVLTAILALLIVAYFVVRYAVPGAQLYGSGGYWAYSAIAIAMGLDVLGLGYFGGKITFPS